MQNINQISNAFSINIHKIIIGYKIILEIETIS